MSVQVFSHKIWPCLETAGQRTTQNVPDVLSSPLFTPHHVPRKVLPSHRYSTRKHTFTPTIHLTNNHSSFFISESGGSVCHPSKRAVHILPWVCQSIFIHGQLLQWPLSVSTAISISFITFYWHDLLRRCAHNKKLTWLVILSGLGLVPGMISYARCLQSTPGRVLMPNTRWITGEHTFLIVVGCLRIHKHYLWTEFVAVAKLMTSSLPTHCPFKLTFVCNASVFFTLKYTLLVFVALVLSVDVECPVELHFRECIPCCPTQCNIERMCIDSKLQCLDGCYCPEGSHLIIMHKQNPFWVYRFIS